MGFFLNNIYSIWKLHFWRFPEKFCHQKSCRRISTPETLGNARNHCLIFIGKIIILPLLDHFDGPQLFFGDRTSLENARNGVFRSSRYCYKKNHRKILIFRKVTDFWKWAFFFQAKKFVGLDIDFFISRDHSK